MRKFRFATLLFFLDVFLCSSAFSAPLCWEKVYSTLVPDRAYVSDGNGFFAGGRGRFVTLEFDVRHENFSKLDVLTAGLPKKMANVDDFFYWLSSFPPSSGVLEKARQAE